MNQKETNVRETLSMADKIGRVEPSNELLNRLKMIPDRVQTTYDKVPKKVVWAVAASVAVLIVFNVFSLREYNEKKEAQTTTETEAYFSYLKHL